MLQIQVDTTDGGDIPAGTTWSLSGVTPQGSSSGAGRVFASQTNTTQSGTLASPLPGGSLLPNTNPVAFGIYTLTIDAPGYQLFIESIDHLGSTGTETPITVRLVAIPAASPVITAVPTGTTSASITPVPTRMVAVNELPNTGAGTPGTGSWSLLLLMIAGGLAIGGIVPGFRLRRR